MEGKNRADARSVATYPTMMFQGHQVIMAILTFASEWYFKPEGVSLVKKRFERELMRLNLPIQVSHYWNKEEQSFRVRCARADVSPVRNAFQTLVTGVIREGVERATGNDTESGEDDYGFDQDTSLGSPLIEHLGVWRRQHGLITSLANDEVVEQLSAAPEEEFPVELKSYKFRRTWNCPDSISVNDLLSTEDIAELERGTICHFDMDLNNNTIYVGGHEEEFVQLAAHKLDNILNNWEFRNMWFDHVFYTEEVEGVKFVLKYFVDVKKFYFETTLLDNLHVSFLPSNYETLTNAVTVRYAPLDPVKSAYVPIKKVVILPIPSSGLSGTGAFTAPFTYNGKGDASENPLRYRPSNVSDTPDNASPGTMQQVPAEVPLHLRQGPELDAKTQSVEQWANQLPGINPLGFSAAVSSSTSHALQSGPNISNALPASQGKSNSMPKIPDWDAYEEYSFEEFVKAGKKEHNPSKDLTSKPEHLHSRAPSARAPPTSVLHDTVPLKPNQATTLSQTIFDQQASPLHLGRLQEALVPETRYPNVQVQSIQYSQASAAPRTTRASSAPQAVFVPQGVLLPQVPAPRPINLLFANVNVAPHLLDDATQFVGDVLTPVVQQPAASGSRGQVEAMQTVSETSSRTFHETMSQRAPNPRFNLFTGRLDVLSSPGEPSHVFMSEDNNVDPLPRFIQEVNASFMELMRGLRGYRGEVTVQAQFGRIILGNVHQKHISTKTRDVLHFTRDLHNLLLRPTELGPTTNFTNILTTAPAEIQFMIGLKGRDGKNLWESKLFSWDVTYEFVFFDNSATENTLVPFMVEINAETFATQIKTRRPLGDMYVHGTKRHWDFKIAAIGHGRSRALEEKHGELASCLVSSLYIPTGSQQPILSGQIDRSFLQRYELVDISVHRICRYKSTDQKSILKVTEVQSLDVNGGPALGMPFDIYEATPCPADVSHYLEKLGSWYEASIFCAELDDLLEQNKSLELGDKAGWTLDEVANMYAAKFLCLPAVEMLKQMDAVGQSNHNDSDFRSREPGLQHFPPDEEMRPIEWW